ncbi:MAG TPA: hypothetical protein VFP43_26570 [Mesorhizobium sp.]|nr:hypothetical protein [Mesorhizobium sp.]
MHSMVVIVPELTGYASIRRIAVSLPYAAQLIDGPKRQRAPSAASMRTQVRWVQKCDSA